MARCAFGDSNAQRARAICPPKSGPRTSDRAMRGPSMATRIDSALTGAPRMPRCSKCALKVPAEFVGVAQVAGAEPVSHRGAEPCQRVDVRRQSSGDRDVLLGVVCDELAKPP